MIQNYYSGGIKMKKVKISTIVLIIALISMISAFGLYGKVQNRMEDKVKNYAYAMDLNGARNIKLTVNTQNKEVIKDSEGKIVEAEEELTDEQLKEKGYTKESVANNSQEVLTKENYEKTKKILEDRFKEQGIGEYEISLNEENGEILIKIPENKNTDKVVSNLNTVGKFEIIDSETKEVLMNNNDLKRAKVMYGSSSTSNNGTTVYLDMEFTKEGTKKLEDISNNYKKVEEEQNTNTNGEAENNNTTANEETNNEANQSEENTEKEKQITMKLDDQEIMTTSFDETIRTGTLQLSIGASATDSKTLQGYAEQAGTIASVLNSGNMPVKYDISQNEYILSDVTSQDLQYVKLAVVIAIAVAIIILVIRFKINGLLAGISFIGFTAIYNILLKYTNVTLSIQGIFGIAIILVLGYIFINMILTKIKNSKEEMTKEEINKLIKESYKEFFIKIIPICIAVVVFCFTNWMTISSFGMVMFWGITLMAIWNLVTVTLLKIRAER